MFEGKTMDEWKKAIAEERVRRANEATQEQSKKNPSDDSIHEKKISRDDL